MRKSIGACVGLLIERKGIRKTIKYLAPDLRIKATKRSETKCLTEILLGIGRPNYAERQFVKLCQKAGEEFPIRKIQIE